VYACDLLLSASGYAVSAANSTGGSVVDGYLSSGFEGLPLPISPYVEGPASLSTIWIARSPPRTLSWYSLSIGDDHLDSRSELARV
jgi:hypothetical protein